MVELPCEEIEKFRLRKDDLLACRFNGNLRFVGRISLYRADSGRVQVNPDKLIRFRIDKARCLPRFVCHAMNSRVIRREIEALCATTAGNIGISAADLKAVSIPVPPLAEQERVIARIETLLAQCDQLEGQLSTACRVGASLLDATLHRGLTAGARTETTRHAA